MAHPGRIAVASGIRGIDGPLGGRFGAGSITDIFGPPASGKTQLAYHVCARAARAGARVLFVDTKGEFRPERILEMAGGEMEALDRIWVMRTTNVGEQASALRAMGGGNFSLAVVDGVTDLFSFEYGGRQRPRWGGGRMQPPPAPRPAAPGAPHRAPGAGGRYAQFMAYARGLAGEALAAGVPAIVTNTVRVADGVEVESMGRAMELFAHVRIRLHRDDSDKYGDGGDAASAAPAPASVRGELVTINASSRFALRVTASGVAEDPAPPPGAGAAAASAAAAAGPP